MYSHEEHRQIAKDLLADVRLNKISNRFTRMRFLVENRTSQLRHFGETVAKHCEEYEREHCKLNSWAVYYHGKAETCFEKLANAPKQVNTDEAYNELIRVTNNVLLYLPYNWDDASSMSLLGKLYGRRAQVEFERGHLKMALSNLRHALVAIGNFNQSQLQEHMNASLLISMMSIGASLLEQMKIPHKTNFLMALKECSNGNFEDDPLLIKKLSSTLEEYHESQNQSKLKGNFELNDKLRLIRTEDGGRFYQATAHIQKGESILSDRAQSVTIFAEHRFDFCDFCHQKMDTFWPCSGCSELGYCSAKCAGEAYQKYHQFECGIYGLMLGQEDYYWMAHVYRHYLTFGIDVATKCEDEQSQIEVGIETPFDLEEYFNSEELRTQAFADFSPSNRKLLCQAITSLQSNRGKRSLQREHSHAVMAITMVHYFIYKKLLLPEITEDSITFSRILENLCSAMLRICTNGFCWTEDIDASERTFIKVASCVCLSASFINHSCDPCVNWQVTENGLILMEASRAIEPGEPLTTCYGPKKYNKFDDRQERLRNDYCFFCRCTVCLSDCANMPDTLKCPGSNGACRGPLVLNQFNSCLQCGQEASLLKIEKLSTVAKKASTDFARNLQKLYSKKSSRFAFLGELNCVKWPSKESETTFDVQEDEDEASLRMQEAVDVFTSTKKSLTSKINPARMALKRIYALERELSIYSEVIFEGNFHLFEKYVLMLKVYEDSKLTDRGLMLLEPLSRSLQFLTPSLADSSFSKLLHLLNYAAKFCETYASVHKNQIPYLAQEGILSEQSRVEGTTRFWTISREINAKLAAILQYDVENRGDFFPVAHQKLLTDLKEDSEPTGEEQIPDAEERYHEKLLGNCLRRLNHIEQFVGA